MTHRSAITVVTNAVMDMVTMKSRVSENTSFKCVGEFKAQSSICTAKFPAAGGRRSFDLVQVQNKPR